MTAMNQNIVDLSQLNLEEMIREMGEEKVVRMMTLILENNKKIFEFQVMIKEKEKQENQR